MPSSEKPYEQTLEFENPRVLSTLYAGDLRNLKKVEDTLGIKAATREGWLKLTGSKDQVLKAVALFEHLLLTRDQGVQIRTHDFSYSLNAIAQGKAGDLAKMFHGPSKILNSRGFIAPKTLGQREYIDLIREKDLCFGIGPAGTGKTYLAVAMALSYLKEDLVRRVILTRPAVETGESLGYLPGDLEEKITPYLRPLFDAIQDMLLPAEAQKFQEKNVIEIAPLAYMRGRTLSNAFIILDEAQNTTAEQMFMFLTRLGTGSKCVVTGDITQTDLPGHKKSGLVEAVSALRHLPEVGFKFFEEGDVIRHELVAKIVRAYRSHREPLAEDKPAKSRATEV